MTRPIPSSRHFTLEHLAEGVYAAIHADDGWAVSNAGIIDLGDRTLVFDTFLTPAAAEGLRQVAEALFDREVHLVVNSHFHNDHIWGNQVFAAGADVISTIETRRLIETAGMEEFIWFRDNSARRLEEVRQQCASAQDDSQRHDLSQWSVYYQALIETCPSLRMRLPSLTFQDRLVLHGPRRSVELISLGSGHTGDDSALYLPGEGILFMSDLLFVGHHPYLPDGDPMGWLHALERAATLPAQVFVPGHGQVGTRADLDRMRDYILSCQELARGMVERGEQEEAAVALPVPVPFQRWRYAMFFKSNVRFLYQRYSQGQPDGAAV